MELNEYSHIFYPRGKWNIINYTPSQLTRYWIPILPLNTTIDKYGVITSTDTKPIQ